MQEITDNPETIRAGDRVRLELPGVPAWNVPATASTATVREESREELLEDLRESIDRGGARVYLLA